MAEREGGLWTAAFAPATLAEVAGNAESLTSLGTWAADVGRGKPVKPLLVWGPPGTGKTAAVRAMAAEHGWELVESGANDARNPEGIARLFGAGASGLFGKKRLVFFDEVDALFDRGEAKALAKAIGEGGAPIVLGATDYWDPKMADLRKLCQAVEFKSVNLTALRKVALNILTKSSAGAIDVKDPLVLERVNALCSDANGDVRALVIDLQACFAGGKASATWNSERERQKNIFRVVGKIFKATSATQALDAGDASTEDLDTLLSWLEENSPVEYSPADSAVALEWLARADRFNRLAFTRRHFALLRYARFVGLAGVAASKTKAGHAFVSYKFPSWIKRLSQSRMNRGLIDAAALKAGRKLHTSKRRARTEDLPALSKLPGAAAYFGWTEDEAQAVTGK